MTRKIPKNASLWLAALALVLGISAVRTTAARSAAPDISATWQATLGAQSPKPLRLVLRISKDASGDLTGAVYSIDQGTEAIQVREVTLQGDTFSFTAPDVGGTYTGKLSADGTSIAGTWTQRQPLPLTFTRVTPQNAWPIGHIIGTQYVTVGKNVRLEVLDWGGTGRPVVLLAGLGNSAHVFDAFAVKLRANYHVYGITRRGFGESSAPAVSSGVYTADRLGDDVLAVIDALKLNRPVLMGHSIAGEELSSIGTRHPEKVAGLVYLDAGYSYALYNPAYKEPSPPPGVTLPPIYQAVEDGQQKYSGPIRDPILAIFAVPHDMKQRYPNDAAAQTAAEAKDLVDTGGQVEAFQRGLPSARVIRLAHANHYVFESNQAEVLDEVNAFIAKLP
jgi:non-heme chloroperoxidase